jgi:YegS/Rv2252/BmrU family lipid kinase
MVKTPTALVILNPIAGMVNEKILRRLIESRFQAAGWTTRVHLTKPKEDLCAIIQKETAKGIDMVVAAGGDGTIAAVAGGMAHSNIPLGLIPCGTWNAIGRHFRISTNPLRAITTITGAHKMRRMDLIKVGDNLHAMNLGMGFSSTMVANTSRSEKRRLGNLAYYANFLKQFFGLKLKKYIIDADGKIFRGRASEIMVANYGIVGLNFIEDTLDICPDDGKIDVFIFKTRTLLDLPGLFWQAVVKRKKRTPKYHHLSAVSKLTIQTSPPVFVQADGELLGKTPITLTVLSRSVKVIVPKKYPG